MRRKGRRAGEKTKQLGVLRVTGKDADGRDGGPLRALIRRRASRRFVLAKNSKIP
jgi:hypothetical protein